MIDRESLHYIALNNGLPQIPHIRTGNNISATLHGRRPRPIPTKLRRFGTPRLQIRPPRPFFLPRFLERRRRLSMFMELHPMQSHHRKSLPPLPRRLSLGGQNRKRPSESSAPQGTLSIKQQLHWPTHPRKGCSSSKSANPKSQPKQSLRTSSQYSCEFQLHQVS